MKKSAKDGTFGAPKPLPGQAGYKMTESDFLEKEAKEMEMRLQVLQERLTQQKMDETKPAGSSRWKSSRPEKGSIRSYGKDVTDKFRTRILERENSAESSIKMSATMPSSAAAGNFSPDLSLKPSSESPRKVLTSGNFTTKDVADWNTDDVGDWLNHLQLGQYSSVFAQNEINGGVLLDLTLDDLDYLNITVLAHRKTILRAIEEIRRQQKSSAKPTSLPAGLMRSQSANRIDIDDSAVVGNSYTKSIENTKPVHWSQLEPLSAKPVKGGQLPINAADEGPIDEEAERIAFQQAVEEWRRADAIAAEKGKKLEIVREYDTGKKSSTREDFGVTASDGDDGMWKNPWGSAPVEEKKKPAVVSDSSLLDGQLDEEREREEFKKAVEAWRSSNKKPVPKQEESKSSNHASESVSVGDSSTVTTQSAQALAEMLAKKMEQEQQEVVMKIQRQKEEAARRLAQANQELEKLRLVKVNSMDYSKPLSSSSKSPRSESKDGAAPFVYSKAPTEATVSFDDSDNESPVKANRKSWTSPKKSDYKESYDAKFDYKQEEPERPSTVKIALVESIIGDPNEFGPIETDACVVVEYDSDN